MRDRVIDELRSAPAGSGVDVQTLARALGLHPNSVRWHLGTLERDGLVTSEPRATARRGRPRLVYRLRPAALAGTREEYRLLAAILSGTVADAGAGAAAERAGRVWGRQLVKHPLPLLASAAEARTAVVSLLDAQGFDAESDGEAIRIRRCPFRELAEAEPDVVCAVHKGLLDGALEGLGVPLEVDALDPFPEPDVCVVRFRKRPSSPPAA